MTAGALADTRFDGRPRLCCSCGERFAGVQHSRTCEGCKARSRSESRLRYMDRVGRARRRHGYKICPRCGQIDNAACAACRERMHGRAHKQAIRDALRAAGVPSSERHPMYARGYHLLRAYGVTLEWYDRKFAEQGGLCAICRRPPDRRALSVDHDHAAGRIRGLLCYSCNSMLGRAHESTERLAAAIAYIEAYR